MGAFRHVDYITSRNSLVIEDTTTFGKTVVLYMEMQQSDVMINRGAQCYAISVPRLMMYYVITSLGMDMFSFIISPEPTSIQSQTF